MKKNTLLFVLMVCLCVNLARGGTRFNHILITNDDGIEDADRLLALAKAVKGVAKRVSIIVSAFDRSGTSNHMLYGKHQRSLEVTCRYRDEANGITAYTLPLNPADCVLVGLAGFFGEDRPDLVLSGINSGPNIGPDWFGSGTIGAARTAAFMGVKAVAFSGFDDDNDASFTVIPNWIRDLISSGILDEIDRHGYLTVGLPRRPLEKIKGVRMAARRISYDKPGAIGLKKIFGEDRHSRENRTIWVLDFTGDPADRSVKMDDDLLREGYIVITPMTVDENNPPSLRRIETKSGLIPGFPERGEESE